MMQFLTPVFFERMLFKHKKIFFGISFFLLSVGLYFALYASPEDYQQGQTVRIMYVHVPSAWASLFFYGLMVVFSLIGLLLRIPFSFLIVQEIAPIGAVFAFITLVTGSLWGKPMWGAFWVWDARLTSMLLLFIIYLAILSLFKSFQNSEKGQKAAAFLTLVGGINLPIIKWSVSWWNTLHQPASVTRLGMPSIHYSMLIPLLIMSLAFLSLGISLFLLRLETQVLFYKMKARLLRYKHG
jgi:heme exporter protein C